MRYGTIVKYFPDKQYGFIRPDSGKDVFFHVSAIDAGEIQLEIKLGQPVKYETMPRGEAMLDGGRGGSTERAVEGSRPEQTRAKLVTLIDKLPGGTLADVDASLYSNRHRRARKRKPTWRS